MSSDGPEPPQRGSRLYFTIAEIWRVHAERYAVVKAGVTKRSSVRFVHAPQPSGRTATGYSAASQSLTGCCDAARRGSRTLFASAPEEIDSVRKAIHQTTADVGLDLLNRRGPLPDSSHSHQPPSKILTQTRLLFVVIVRATSRCLLLG